MEVSSDYNPVLTAKRFEFSIGGGFDNWLDAVDSSFCGGDVPGQVGLLFPSLTSLHNCQLFVQDGIYPDPLPGGFKGRHFLEKSSLNAS